MSIIKVTMAKHIANTDAMITTIKTKTKIYENLNFHLQNYIIIIHVFFHLMDI